MAVCIEAKLESGEGSYPGSKADQAVFNRRGIGYVGQRDIQEMILRDILGVDVVKKYLVKKKNEDDPECITWQEIFQVMDYSDSPDFIKAWIGRLN